MSLQDDLALIESVWGSEGALNSYLDAEVSRLCSIVCGGDAPVPLIEVHPESLARGLIGGRTRGGEYEPAEDGREARIVVFPPVCADKSLLTIALAHELVHHWEATSTELSSLALSVPEAEETIESLFPDSKRRRSWSMGHSQRFVAKASVVAARLGLPLREFLAHA